MIQALKKLFIFFCILLVTGYVGNLLLDNPYMHGVLRNAINDQLRTYTHLNVKFEAVGAKFLPPGLEVYGVEINDTNNTELLRASHIKADVSLRALLFSRKQLFNIEINEPRVSLPLPPLAELLRLEKFPDLLKDTGPPVWPPKQALPFYRLAITNGQVSLRLKDNSKDLLSLVTTGLDLEIIYQTWNQFQVDLTSQTTNLALDGKNILADAKIQLDMNKVTDGLRSDVFRIDSKEITSTGQLRVGFELSPPARTGRVLKGLNIRLDNRVSRADFAILGRYLGTDNTDGEAAAKVDLQLQIPFDDRKITWDLDGEGQAKAARIAGFKLHESKADFTVRNEGMSFEKISVIKDGKERAKGKGFLSFQKDSKIVFEVQPQDLPMKDLMGMLQVDNFEAFEAKLAPTQLEITGQMQPFHLDITGPVIFDELTFPFVKSLGPKFPQAPHCELKAEMSVTEKVFTIHKGDGYCQASEASVALRSPLDIKGKITYSQKDGMDLTIESDELNGGLLDHFIKLPTTGTIETSIRIAGPYNKLIIGGEASAPSLNISGFDFHNIDSDFSLPIAKNSIDIKHLTAQLGMNGILAINGFSMGLTPDLPFRMDVTAKQVPSHFISEGLSKTLGHASLRLGIDSFRGHLAGKLLMPLHYEGEAQVILRDIGYEDEQLLTEARVNFLGTKSGQSLREGTVRLDRLNAHFSYDSSYEKATRPAPLPGFLQGLGIDDKTQLRFSFHTINDSQDHFRVNKIDESENQLASLPYAGKFFREQKIGGVIELNTDLEGPAGRLQGKIDGALQRPFLFNMPVSAFSFSGFLDGTKLQLPEFRHAGNSMVGRLNIDFGKPELPYDWYIYLKQFDARAVLGKFFADDPRNYAYLTAESTMKGQLKNFWKSKGELVFIDLKSKLNRNLGSRTTAMELNSSQTVRIDISPEKWSFEDNKPLKLHGDFFELQISAGNNRLPDNLDLRMQGSIRLDILKSFTNLAETARGELVLDGYLRGSIKNPEFSMRIQERKLDPFNLKEWSPVALGLVNYGPALSAVSMDIEVKQDRLEVHRFRANKGREGTIEITGELLFDQKSKDMSHLLINLDRIEFNRLQIPVLKTADAVVSGDLTLSGNEFPFNLSGNLKIDRFQSIGSFDLRKEIVSSLYETKLFNNIKGSGPVTPLLKLDVAVQADHSIQVKNKTIEARLSANLRVKGTDLQPLLLGQIIADSGTFNYRRTFKITQAVVSFDEPVSPPNPRLDIVGETIINPYKVNVQVTGDLAAPKVTLVSDPPTRDDGTAITSLDIVLLITTGKLSETANKTAAEKASVNEIFSSILVFAEEPIEKLFDLSGQTVVREVYIDSYLSEVQQRPITRLNVPFNLFNQANAVVQVDDESNTKISFEYPLHEGITLTGSLDHKANNRTNVESNVPQDTGIDLKFRFGFD
ncbi:MAG: translocation/assembly module TamB domain-containing protein [Chitinophagaceae bacterium]|nr:translocation/assembly module TamB domain-containing protein [Oligoflexus sp.]